MVLLGWMQDMHIREDINISSNGATSEMQTDYNKLVDGYGVDDVYFTGDQVAPNSSGEPPHISQSAYDNFWNLIDGTTDGGDSIKRLIPGNHDVPVQTHLEQDTRAVLRDRVDYPGENLTVLLVNTQANSFVTGGKTSATNHGTGSAIPRVPYTDIMWLDEQLADAGTNAKLILPHAHLYPASDNTSSSDIGLMGEGQVYHVVTNYRLVHNVLSNHSKVVVPQSHLFSFGSNTKQSNTIDGVDYLQTQHYYRGSDDSVYTFGRIDITGSSVTVTTEEHSDGTEYTLLDKTF